MGKLYTASGTLCFRCACVYYIDTTHAQPLETSPNPRTRVLSWWRPSLETSPNHHQVYIRGTFCTMGDYHLSGRPCPLVPGQGKAAREVFRCRAQELQAQLALEANRKDSTLGALPGAPRAADSKVSRGFGLVTKHVYISKYTNFAYSSCSSIKPLRTRRILVRLSLVRRNRFSSALSALSRLDCRCSAVDSASALQCSAWHSRVVSRPCVDSDSAMMVSVVHRRACARCSIVLA